jgi:predicted transcriptional regulator
MGRNHNSKVYYKLQLMYLRMSQKQLAKELGYSESFISQVISGARNSDLVDDWFKAHAVSKSKKCKATR